MLDKFNCTRFAQEFTSTNGSTFYEKSVTPRVAILGASTFSTEGHSADDKLIKLDDTFTNSVTR